MPGSKEPAFAKSSGSHSLQPLKNDTESDAGSPAENEYILFKRASQHLGPNRTRTAANAHNMTASTGLEEPISLLVSMESMNQRAQSEFFFEENQNTTINTIKHLFPNCRRRTVQFVIGKFVKDMTAWTTLHQENKMNLQKMVLHSSKMLKLSRYRSGKRKQKEKLSWYSLVQVAKAPSEKKTASRNAKMTN